MWLLLTACVHVVAVTTYPAGAAISRDGLAAGNAPTELRVPRFRPTPIAAALPGYQTLPATIPAHWWRARSTLELRLSAEREPLQ